MTPDKDQKIAELQEHAKAPTEHSHFESKTTVDVEDRIAALSDFIKFRSLETLMKRLQGRRLGSSLNSISLFPYFLREIAIKRRGPQIKPSEAHFLFLLARLTRTASLHQKLRGLSSIRRRAQASNDLQLREETLRSRSKLRASRVRQLCFIFAQNKEKNLRAAIGRLKLESLQSSFDDHVKVHRWVHGVSLVKSLLAQDRKSRMLQAFICMKNGLISSLKKEVIEITRSIHDHKVYSDKQKQELDNQGTFSLSLKAEINKLKSTQATTQLELQKSQAKVKVLEAENMTLVGRCESLTGTCNQLRDEKNHLEQLTDRIREEYLNLQQDYEEKIDNFNQATEDVSKAAAKSSMERAGLADKIKALIEQREEDKVALYKENKGFLQKNNSLELTNKAVLSQNVELKEKLSETINSLVMMKDEHLRLRKESEEKTQAVEKLNKDKSEMMGELLQLRDLYEQTRSTHSLQLSSKIKEANSQLAAQVDSLKAEISELKDQLSAKEVEHNQAKTKRENIIKDLKRENGSLAEQFIQANTDRNWMKSEIDRLKEESRKTQGFNQNHAQKMKELTDKKEKAEKELKEAKEHVAEMEEELSDIKTKKLPEKEKQIEKYSNTVAELNREKLNNYRDVRNLYDKYMKMEQDCQTNLNIAKEWQNEVDRLQGKMEKYQKVVSQLERELKAAKSQAQRISVSTPEINSDKEHSEELVPSDALLKIKQKYPLQSSNNQSWQGN